MPIDNAEEDMRINRQLMRAGVRLPKKARGDDLPLKGQIVRERKGVYAVIITFAKSRRTYEHEIVHAANQKLVKAQIAKLYPTLKWAKK